MMTKPHNVKFKFLINLISNNFHGFTIAFSYFIFSIKFYAQGLAGIAKTINKNFARGFLNCM